MKKIKSYTGIWNVEKVLYAINDFNLPFPVTFTQISWFVITEFIIILFGDLPPLSMIEGAFLKYFGIPVALTWFMSQKTFDGKKPYSFLKSQITYGYLWWIVDENKHIYSAIGNSGNVIYVNPSNNIVIAITSYFKPTIFDRIDFVQKYVEPVISI